MAKKPKVTIDDFAYEDEEEAQPLQMIAKASQSTKEDLTVDLVCIDEVSTTFNDIQPPSVECHSTTFNNIQKSSQPPSVECHSTTFNVIQPPSQPHSNRPSLTELKVLSFLRILEQNSGQIKATKNEISLACQITIKGVETAIRRLRQKGMVNKCAYTSGRYTGHTEYSLNTAAIEALSSISFNLIQPPSQPPSKKESNYIYNSLTYYIPENLMKIGLKESMIRTERQDLQEILEHLSYSLEHNEFKTNNPLATIRSILNENKDWISGKHLKEQESIIESNKKRLEELKRAETEALKLKWQVFKIENPEFLEEIIKKNKFLKSSEMIEKVAFEEFKSINPINE